MEQVTRRECQLCNEALKLSIQAMSSEVKAEIRALRRELALAVTVSTALISIFIAVRGW